MKLKSKFLLIVLLPILLLGTIIFGVSYSNIKSGIYDEAFNGMQATALTVRNIFDSNHEGDYNLDANNQLWKGATLNISEAMNIVDNIKATTGKEVTIFYNNVRYLTSIMDSAGTRQIGTETSPEISQVVLQKGEHYQADNVSILGNKYLAYYIPMYQESTGQPIGMIFLGTLQSEVDNRIDSMLLRLVIMILIVMVISMIFVTLITRQIVNSITYIVGIVHKLSNGNLNQQIDDKYYNRKDELGILSKSIRELDTRLVNIIGEIKNTCMALVNSSSNLSSLSEDTFDSIKDVDHVVQEIATSATSQASSTESAYEEVTYMGTLVSKCTEDIQTLDSTITSVQESQITATTTLNELSSSMGNVIKVIDNVNQQTQLTNDSVTKISNITNLITAIASQTNLLALNASIEAARAGEEGRGFSVVASEIKNLSTQSNALALEIQNTLGELIHHSNDTVKLMLEAREIIAIQHGNLGNTNEAFITVNNNVQEAIQRIENISSSTVSLDSSRNNTIVAVEALTAIAQENAAGTEEVAASVESIRNQVDEVSVYANDLSKIAMDLQESISIFKL